MIDGAHPRWQGLPSVVGGGHTPLAWREVGGDGGGGGGHFCVIAMLPKATKDARKLAVRHKRRGEKIARKRDEGEKIRSWSVMEKFSRLLCVVLVSQ